MLSTNWAGVLIELRPAYAHHAPAVRLLLPGATVRTFRGEDRFGLLEVVPAIVSGQSERVRYFLSCDNSRRYWNVMEAVRALCEAAEGAAR